jgi:hypothetical protein
MFTRPQFVSHDKLLLLLYVSIYACQKVSLQQLMITQSTTAYKRTECRAILSIILNHKMHSTQYDTKINSSTRSLASFYQFPYVLHFRKLIASNLSFNCDSYSRQGTLNKFFISVANMQDIKATLLHSTSLLCAVIQLADVRTL